MKRVILEIPEGLSFDSLSPEHQSAINSVFGQFVNPMPGTKAANGKQIVDAVTADNFDSEAIGQLGLPFTILAYWEWDGTSLNVIKELLEAYWMPYLPSTPIVNSEGVEIGEMPPLFHMPHSWAGWPV